MNFSPTWRRDLPAPATRVRPVCLAFRRDQTTGCSTWQTRAKSFRWFAGIAHIRGNLHSVVDLSAFVGKEATPRNTSSRLLLIGTRHGSNAALLVNRMIGLRNVEALNPEAAAPDAQAWAPEAYTDNEGRRWSKLKVRELLADEAFMDIGA